MLGAEEEGESIILGSDPSLYQVEYFPVRCAVRRFVLIVQTTFLESNSFDGLYPPVICTCPLHFLSFFFFIVISCRQSQTFIPYHVSAAVMTFPYSFQVIQMMYEITLWG
jgi:hypothetical protein